ncbi:MAG: tetratricopeptide repeat protein [Candidatus Scalindua sp.]|nr:tetratricopeptide repeat protein [Candidatus Scalindua sp.]
MVNSLHKTLPCKIAESPFTNMTILQKSFSVSFLFLHNNKAHEIRHKTIKIILLISVLTILMLQCEAIVAGSGKNMSSAMSSDNEPYVYVNFCTGLYLMIEQRWEEATKFLQKALEINPDAEKVHDLLATCYFKLGKKNLALSHIQKIAQINPHDFAVHYTLGGIYESEGEEKKAISEYESAKDNMEVKEIIDKVFVADMLHRLANLYLKNGDLENAAHVFHKILDEKLTNKPVAIHYKLGQIYFEGKRFEDSKNEFLRVREINPHSESVSLYLSICYEELKDYDKAIAELTPLLDEHSDAWHIRLSLSNIYEKVKKFELTQLEREKVSEILKKNVLNGSTNIREYIVLSQLLQQKGKKTEAVKNLKTALTYLHNKIDEESLQEIQFLMANLYYEMENYEGTIGELRKILTADPDCHQANNFLGYLFVERGEKLDEAVDLIEKALDSEPQNGAYLDSLGWAYYKLATKENSEKMMLALQTLLEAAKYAEDSEIMYHIGEVYYCLGRWEEAKEQWNNALELLKGITKDLPPYLVREDSRESKSMETIRKKLEKLQYLKVVESSIESQKAGKRDVGSLIQ